MPYAVKVDDRCPASKPWGVTNEKTGKLHGCHPSKQHAREQQKALYAATENENPAPAGGRSWVEPEPLSDDELGRGSS